MKKILVVLIMLMVVSVSWPVSITKQRAVSELADLFQKDGWQVAEFMVEKATTTSGSEQSAYKFVIKKLLAQKVKANKARPLDNIPEVYKTVISDASPGIQFMSDIYPEITNATEDVNLP